MILMPYVQGITKSGLPFGVILLVLINTFVYFGPQSHDARRLERASIQYTESILPKVELPHYVDYLKERKETKKARTIESLLSSRQVWYALRIMQSDDEFMKQLRAERIITPDNENFEQWRDARTRLDSFFESSFVERFKFDTARPTFITALTHQFLHADAAGHLFGNMLILIFIGTAVEALIGTSRFLLGYLIGGIGAAAAFWLWRMNASEAAVGASGAISAAMGMFAVLFGTRRIPFFYFIIIYFDIIRAPALLALPIWLANEALQLLWSGGHVAYDAHFGGLVSGAAIALFWRSRALAKLTDEAPALPPEKNPLIHARRMMEKQNFDAARRDYARVAKTTEDCSVLRECWNVITLAPTTSPEYHDIVTAILRQRSRASDVNELVLQVFNHYLKNARPIPRISANTLAALAKRFLHLRRMEELEQVLRLLRSVAPAHPLRVELTEQAIAVLTETSDQGRAKALSSLL